MSDRGVAPVIGVILLIALVAMLGGVVAAVVPGSLDDHSTTAVSIDMEVEVGNSSIVFYHRGGEKLHVPDLAVQLMIEGEPIPHQPDLDGGSQTGIHGFPGGAFNPSTEYWYPGESSSFNLASNNGGDDLEVGSLVTAEFYLDGQSLIELSTRAS